MGYTVCWSRGHESGAASVSTEVSSYSAQELLARTSSRESPPVNIHASAWAIYTGNQLLVDPWDKRFESRQSFPPFGRP